MSLLDNLLALSQAPVPNEYKSTVEREATEMKYQLKAIANVILDDKEELSEEMDDWCNEWCIGIASSDQVQRQQCRDSFPLYW